MKVNGRITEKDIYRTMKFNRCASCGGDLDNDGRIRYCLDCDAKIVINSDGNVFIKKYKSE